MISQTPAREMSEKTYKQQAVSNRLTCVVDYIKENIREDMNLDLLSDKAYMSKSHFSRSFKNELGVASSGYILQERLKRAKKTLSLRKQGIGRLFYGWL